MSTFETCMTTTPNATENLTAVLQCVSDNTDTAFTDLKTGVNIFLLLYGSSLVFFMQAGFAFLCAGSIRSKNIRNIILWNMLDSGAGGLAFWAFGWAFAFGGDYHSTVDMQKTFVGSTDFFLMYDDEIPLMSWLYQFAFATALSSIIAGGIAERCKMTAYLLYSPVTSGFIFPVVAHSVWSTRGWLSHTNVDPLWNSGAIDLAGSGPVHMCGGAATLAATIILGPRIGRFYDKEGNVLDPPGEFTPHSVAYQFLGTFCLWFGWYGFNPCSVGIITDPANAGVVALVAVNTTLAACAGAISAMFTSTLLDYNATGVHTWDTTMVINGCLTGLAAITGPCAAVDTWAGVLIGVIAGWVYIACSKLLIRFKIDDAVDAIPVHLGGGTWGVIATGLLSRGELLATAYGRGSHQGWFFEWGQGSGDFTLMGLQLLEIIYIFFFTFIVMYAYYYILNVLGLFRVDPLEEEAGMDISRHKGPAFDIHDGAPPKEVVEELSTNRKFIMEEHSNSRHGGAKKPSAPSSEDQ